MSNPSQLSAALRAAIRASDLFMCVISEGWETDAEVQAHIAYATRLGKPFRVIVWPGIRLPDTAFPGVTDIQIAQHSTLEEDNAQIQRWIDEWSDQHRAGGFDANDV